MHKFPKKLSYFWSLLLLFTWAGCSNPDLPPTPPAGSINAILSNLPEIEFALPKSLQGEDQKSLSRAIGDTTVLNSGNLQGVKSDAWFGIRQNNGVSLLIDLIFDKIKVLAAENAINTGEPFSLTFTYTELNEIIGMSYYPPGTQITTRGLVNGTTDNLKLYLYMKLFLASGSNSMTNTSYTIINIYGPDNNQTLVMHTGTENVVSYGTVFQTTNSGGYMELDLSNGTGTMFNQSEHYELGAYMTLRKVMALPGGALAVISRMENDSTHTQIAWGNDAMGGIACVYRNINNNIESYNGEFYNSAGNLICTERGDNTLPVHFGTARVNIHPTHGAAPALLYLRQEYVTDHWEYYFADNMETPVWYTIPAYGWDDANSNNIIDYGEFLSGFMWKQQESGGWTEGDVIYQWKNIYSDTGTVVIQEYEQSYTFAAVPVFGRNYYLFKEYPLFQLLPLVPAYAAAFEIRKQELDTVSGQWSDWEGKIRNWSYTNFRYYLNKTGSPDTFDAGVDVLLDNLNQHDIYYWNSGAYEKQKADFYTTTGTIPAYFTAPEQTFVAQVKTQLDNLYNNQYQALSFDDYLSELDVIDPADNYFTLLKE